MSWKLSTLFFVNAVLGEAIGSVWFTKQPPKVLYVHRGHIARFEWDYHVDDRDNEFDINSPRWNYYNSKGVVMNIASEDMFDNWKWIIHRATCPPWLLNPTRVNKESNATLAIKNVTQADNGFYECSLVLLRTSLPIESRVQLVVLENATKHLRNSTILTPLTESPRINRSVSDRTVKTQNGLLVSIRCIATGVPSPSITWYRPDGFNITMSSHPIQGGSKVLIRTLKEGDYGMYKCRAKNSLGTDELNISVVHLYSPTINRSASDKTVKSRNGLFLSIRCIVTGLPSPSITWYRPDGYNTTMFSHPIPGGSVLSIRTLKETDYGMYKCRAKNILGTDDLNITVIHLCLCPTANNTNQQAQTKAPFIKRENFYMVCLCVVGLSVIMNILLILKCKFITKTIRKAVVENNQTVKYGPKRNDKTNSKMQINSRSLDQMDESFSSSEYSQPLHQPDNYASIPDIISLKRLYDEPGGSLPSPCRNDEPGGSLPSPCLYDEPVGILLSPYLYDEPGGSLPSPCLCDEPGGTLPSQQHRDNDDGSLSSKQSIYQSLCYPLKNKNDKEEIKCYQTLHRLEADVESIHSFSNMSCNYYESLGMNRDEKLHIYQKLDQILQQHKDIETDKLYKTK